MSKAFLDGAKVREMRASKLITQQELAVLAGISVETMCRLESLSRPAHFKTIHKIADALKVPANEIVAKGE